MFSEILRIRPQLDRASLASMTNTLNRRFARVANRFRTLMRNALRGTALGISLALIARILNPLQAIEERIKSILGYGRGITDIADRFGTSTTRIQQLREVAAAQGLSAQDLNSLMESFARAVETARDEFEDPFKAPSAQSLLVQDFMGRDDLAEAFWDFMTGLRRRGEGGPQDVFWGDMANRVAFLAQAEGRELTEAERANLISQGVLTQESGARARRRAEMLIFGAEQFGAERRFIDIAGGAAMPEIGGGFDRATGRAAALSNREALMEAQRERRLFLAGEGNLRGQVIDLLHSMKESDEMIQVNAISNTQKLIEAADNMRIMKVFLNELATNYVPTIVNLLGDGVGILKGLVDDYRKGGIRGVLKGPTPAAYKRSAQDEKVIKNAVEKAKENHRWRR